MVTLIGFSSAVYLVCTHTLLSREKVSGSGDGGRDSSGGGGGGGGGHSVDHSKYVGSGLVDDDPRFIGGSAGGQGGASGGVRDLPLACPNGDVPDVDLAYWKSIPGDR